MEREPNIMSKNSSSGLIYNENNFYHNDLSLYVDSEHRNNKDKLTSCVHSHYTPFQTTIEV